MAKKEKGFTLIELIGVLVIIGIITLKMIYISPVLPVELFLIPRPFIRCFMINREGRWEMPFPKDKSF